MLVGGPACVNTEAVTDPALPRPMSEDYQAPSGVEQSPAAQAVLDAVALAMEGGWISPEFTPYEARKAAAALRAAAEQAENVYPVRPSTEWGEGWLEGVQDVVASFRRIAAELEGAQ